MKKEMTMTVTLQPTPKDIARAAWIKHNEKLKEKLAPCAADFLQQTEYLGNDTDPDTYTATREKTTTALVKKWKKAFLRPNCRGILRMRAGQIAQQWTQDKSAKLFVKRICPCSFDSFNHEHVLYHCPITSIWQRAISRAVGLNETDKQGNTRTI